MIKRINILRHFPLADIKGSRPPPIPAYAVLERLKIEIDKIVTLNNQPTGRRSARKKYGVERNCSFSNVFHDNTGYPNLNELIITLTKISKTA
jgi:hypothetical protein